MCRQVTGVTDGANYRDPLADTLPNHFRQRIVQITRFKVAASGYIHNSNIVKLAMFENIGETGENIFLTNTASFSKLDQDDIGGGGETPVKSIRRRPFSRRDNRRHHAVPAGNVWLKQ